MSTSVPSCAASTSADLPALAETLSQQAAPLDYDELAQLLSHEQRGAFGGGGGGGDNDGSVHPVGVDIYPQALSSPSPVASHASSGWSVQHAGVGVTPGGAATEQQQQAQRPRVVGRRGNLDQKGRGSSSSSAPPLPLKTGSIYQQQRPAPPPPPSCLNGRAPSCKEALRCTPPPPTAPSATLNGSLGSSPPASSSSCSSASASSTSDWIELSTSVSSNNAVSNNNTKDFKRELLSKALNSHPLRPRKGDNLILGLSQTAARLREDEAALPLLAKEVCQESPSPLPTLAAPPAGATSSPSRSSHKGPAPQPPARDSAAAAAATTAAEAGVVCSQPTRSCVSRGLQVETEDLIQFSSCASPCCGPECPGSDTAAAAAAGEGGGVGDAQRRRKRPRPSEHNRGESAGDGEEEEEEDDDEEHSSARTADEQIDYLESLEPCPCYAKCCIDSVITLFCVTLLG